MLDGTPILGVTAALETTRREPPARSWPHVAPPSSRLPRADGLGGRPVLLPRGVYISVKPPGRPEGAAT
jgi:hypothetical protein